MEELKYVRDSIVGGLSIPPAFLGVEESLSNKNALTNENILFARAITNYQKTFVEQIIELISKSHPIKSSKKTFTRIKSKNAPMILRNRTKSKDRLSIKVV